MESADCVSVSRVIFEVMGLYSKSVWLSVEDSTTYLVVRFVADDGRALARVGAVMMF
jgi:hypothetical protein